MNVGDKVTLVRCTTSFLGGATSRNAGQGVVIRRYKHINSIVIRSGSRRYFIRLDDPSIAVYLSDAGLRPEVKV